jgi:hypothetical protein
MILDEQNWVCSLLVNPSPHFHSPLSFLCAAQVSVARPSEPASNGDEMVIERDVRVQRGSRCQCGPSHWHVCHRSVDGERRWLLRGPIHTSTAASDDDHRRSWAHIMSDGSSSTCTVWGSIHNQRAWSWGSTHRGESRNRSSFSTSIRSNPLLLHASGRRKNNAPATYLNTLITLLGLLSSRCIDLVGI